MPSWATCSGCGLKHTLRPSRTCPKCGQSVRPPEAPAEPPLQVEPGPELPPLRLAASIEAEGEGLSKPARLAGVLMVVNGFLLMAERSTMAKAAADGSLSSGGAPLLGSFLIGGLVAFGSTRAARLAQVVVFLGLTFVSLSLLGSGQRLLAGLQLCYSAGLLLLLFRRAPPWRAITGVILVALPFGMQTLGLYGIATGHFPLGRLMAASDLTGLGKGAVKGTEFQYLIDNPGRSWYARSAAALARDKAAADVWLTRPDRDAHILVVPEALGANMTLDMDRFQEAVIRNYAGSSFEVRTQTPIAAGAGEARLLQGKGRVSTGELDFLIALYVQPPYAVQVVGFGPAASFGEVSEDVLRVVTSLRF